MVATREGNSGSGIDYEDSVKVSAILHYYIGLKFLDKFDILNIQLNPFTKIETDDLLINTKDNQSVYIQIKSTVRGINTDPFIKFITQSYKDYLITRDIDRTFYLIMQSSTEKFFKRITGVLSRIKCKPYNEYIKENDADLLLFDEINNILKLKNNDELYLFLNTISIVKKEKIKDLTALKNDEHLIIRHLDNASDHNIADANVFHVISFIDNYIKSTKINSPLIDNETVQTIFEGIVKYKKNKTIHSIKNDIKVLIDDINDIIIDLDYEESSRKIEYFFKKNSILLRKCKKIISDYKIDINLLDTQTYIGYKSLHIAAHFFKIITLDINSIKEKKYDGFVFDNVSFDEFVMDKVINYDFEKRIKKNNGEIFKDDNFLDEANNLFFSSDWYFDETNKKDFFIFFKQLFDIIVDDNNNFLQWNAIYTFTRKKNKNAFMNDIKEEMVNKIIYLSNQKINIPLFFVYAFELNNRPDRRFSVPLLISNEIQKIISLSNKKKINICTELNIQENYTDIEVLFMLAYIGYTMYHYDIIDMDPDFSDELYTYSSYKQINIDHNMCIIRFFEQLVFEFDSEDAYVQENFPIYKEKIDSSDLKKVVEKCKKLEKYTEEELNKLRKFLSRGSQILENIKIFNKYDLFS